MDQPLEVTPRELKTRLEGGENIVLIDVREPDELELSKIENALLIPMQSVPGELQRLEGIADEADLAIFCHHGVRSLNVAMWLRQHGLENCFSMTGGIDQWSREIDATVPRY